MTVCRHEATQVRGLVPEAKLVRDAGLEMAFNLPLCAAPRFPELFRALEAATAKPEVCALRPGASPMPSLQDLQLVRSLPPININRSSYPSHSFLVVFLYVYAPAFPLRCPRRSLIRCTRSGLRGGDVPARQR